MKFADLHIHSRFSDSSLSCGEIFSQARSNNLDCISITDHDTLDFYFSSDASRLPEEYSIELIKGIEFSAQYNDRELHLLGYFGNHPFGDKFLNILKKLKEDRYNRIIKMIGILSSLGIKIELDEFRAFAGESSLSRLHLGIFMKYKEIVKNIKEAFSRYIGVGKPAYVARFRYKVREAISILKEEGAMVFLAHPRDVENCEDINGLIQLGLDGIEVFYPSYTPQMITFYKNFADDSGVFICGGSDSHGEYKRHSIGSIRLPYEYVEKIKNEFR